MDGKTIWELAMDAFNETGIEIYPPATKNGECKNPYVVLKTEGSTQIPGYSSEYHYYSFLCYVPQNQYSELEKLKSKVKKVLSDKINGPVFRAGALYIQFRSDCLHIRTIDIKWMVTLPYKNIELVAVESDECGELYLLIIARDGLRVILDESAVSFTAEAKRQVLEE